jgi:small-conductance mechanosensitive channel
MDFLPGSFTDFLNTSFIGNTVQSYMIALGIFLAFFIFIKLFKRRIFEKIKLLTKKTKTDFDDEVVDIIESVPDFLYLYVSLYAGLQFISINQNISKGLDILLVVFVIFWATQAISRVIEYALYKIGKSRKEEVKRGEKNTTYFALALIAKIILWSVGILLVLANLGVDITALVASLGIGGIAVALALQNILSDIFSSFSLYLDKPFEVGDYVVVGEHSGTIKKIGLKTTRIQALQGEEIVIANNELTSTRIQNFKRLKKRRVSFAFGVTYSTPSSKLEKIPKMVKQIMSKKKLLTFDRAHFKSFGDSSLDFEVVYYIDSADYAEYMDHQQSINLAILKAFEKEGIDMAFPTRTIYLEK